MQMILNTCYRFLRICFEGGGYYERYARNRKQWITQTVMQGSVVLAMVLLIVAFICLFQGISAGVFLFVLAFVLGPIVLGIGTTRYFRNSWGGLMKQPRSEGKLPSEPLDDLKMRYAKGEITTEQFRQLK